LAQAIVAKGFPNRGQQHSQAHLAPEPAFGRDRLQR